MMWVANSSIRSMYVNSSVCIKAKEGESTFFRIEGVVSLRFSVQMCLG